MAWKACEHTEIFRTSRFWVVSNCETLTWPYWSRYLWPLFHFGTTGLVVFFEYCSAYANTSLVICYPSANEVMNTYARELYRGDKNRVVEDIRTSFHYTNNTHKWISFDSSNIILPLTTVSIPHLLGLWKIFVDFFSVAQFWFSWIWRGRWARSGRTLEWDGVCEPLHGRRLRSFGWFGSPNIMEVGWMGHLDIGSFGDLGRP